VTLECSTGLEPTFQRWHNQLQLVHLPLKRALFLWDQFERLAYRFYEKIDKSTQEWWQGFQVFHAHFHHFCLCVSSNSLSPCCSFHFVGNKRNQQCSQNPRKAWHYFTQICSSLINPSPGSKDPKNDMFISQKSVNYIGNLNTNRNVPPSSFEMHKL